MISGKFHFATFFVQFGLFILQFILSLIQEPKSPYHFTGDVSVFSPSILSYFFLPYLSFVLLFLSPFPSLLTFSSPSLPLFVSSSLSKRKPCPEEFAPFFSRITWWWHTKLVNFYTFSLYLLFPIFCGPPMIACAGPVYQNNVENINVHVVSAFKLYVLCVLFNT